MNDPAVNVAFVARRVGLDHCFKSLLQGPALEVPQVSSRESGVTSYEIATDESRYGGLLFDGVYGRNCFAICACVSFGCLIF